MLFKKILVAVDFSEITESVVNSALFLGKLFNSEITLLYAIEPPIITIYENPLLDNTEIILELENILKKKFSEHLDKYVELFEKAGLKANKIVDVGSVAETILETADSIEADLIIIGSHKKGLIEKLLLGSVAERVLNKARTSVLVVKGNELTHIERILCGYDFLPNSQKALEIAVELAKKTSAEIEVLHADYDEWFTHFKNVYEEVYNKKLNLLKQIEEELKKENIKIKIKIEKGKPEKVILDEIKNYNPDLTILGKRKSPDIKRIFLGTVAMKVIKGTDKPILIVKRRQD
jgi:nucleotide-binding universal stress UspA family protein